MTRNEPELNELARHQILASAELALRRAGVSGILPTPLDAVVHAAGISEIVDIGHLPADVERKKPWFQKRILGAIVFREQVVFIDRTMPEPRVRFTKAHEAGHGIIPWHRSSYHLDHEGTLAPDVREKLEIEANLAGAHLLFQGRAFHQRALDWQVGIGAPLALNSTYGTSAHATIRYYAEHHPDAIAVLMAGSRVGRNGQVRLWLSVESPPYRSRFGRLADAFPDGQLDVRDGAGTPFGDIIHTCLTGGVAEKNVDIIDANGDRQAFVAEAFSNGWTVFIMVSERSARRLGRRLRVEAVGSAR